MFQTFCGGWPPYTVGKFTFALNLSPNLKPRWTARFSLVAILILALGIGAGTAVFSVVHAVVLKPLAFHEADRLVALIGWEGVLAVYVSRGGTEFSVVTP